MIAFVQNLMKKVERESGYRTCEIPIMTQTLYQNAILTLPDVESDKIQYILSSLK